jgi:hypothetical protein
MARGSCPSRRAAMLEAPSTSTIHTSSAGPTTSGSPTASRRRPTANRRSNSACGRPSAAGFEAMHRVGKTSRRGVRSQRPDGGHGHAAPADPRRAGEHRVPAPSRGIGVRQHRSAPVARKALCLPSVLADTPALRLIPGHEDLVKIARQRNPHKRLTVPEDAARCITAAGPPRHLLDDRQDAPCRWRRERRRMSS